MPLSSLVDSLLEEQPELPLQPTAGTTIIVDNHGNAKVVKVKRGQIQRLEPAMAPSDYYSKPTFNPVGEALFREFMGVELEVEVDYKDSTDKETLKKARNRAVYLANKSLNSGENSGFSIIKCDGSLANGFEICSRPASMSLHKTAWNKFFEETPSNVVAKDTCGMHVHISKEPLSSLQIGKILVFLHSSKNRKFIETIAGRASCHYSDFSSERRLNHALNKYKGSFTHYSAVNLLNPNTIEIRIFKSTVDKTRFFANLEFCHALVKFTFPGTSSITDCSQHSKFIEFVACNRKFYPNLVNFLIEKKNIHSDLEVKEEKHHRLIR